MVTVLALFIGSILLFKFIFDDFETIIKFQMNKTPLLALNEKQTLITFCYFSML